VGQSATLLTDLVGQLEEFAAQRDELARSFREFMDCWPSSTSTLAAIRDLSEALLIATPAATPHRKAQRKRRDYDYFSDLDLALQRLELEGGGPNS
jgi:hypothetical protein